MKNLIIISNILLLFSCKKENLDPLVVEPQVEFNTPKTIGSYWVYEWYRIEKNGDESLLPYKDSIYIVGDTFINNLSYTVYYGTSMGSNPTIYMERDSSGYIVDNRGYILYSYINFNDTLRKAPMDSLFGWSKKMVNSLPVTVPVGTFNSIEARRTYYRFSGEPLTTCGNPTAIYSSWYVDGVGKVIEQTGYISEMLNCGAILESRLVHYYIAP